jgi:hypothetical protein
LTLAVIKSKFTEEHKKKKGSGKGKKKKNKRKKDVDLSDEDDKQEIKKDDDKDNQAQNEDLDPETKRIRRNKEATYDMLRKLDVLLAQKEVVFKITPRFNLRNMRASLLDDDDDPNEANYFKRRNSGTKIIMPPGSPMMKHQRALEAQIAQVSP